MSSQSLEHQNNSNIPYKAKEVQDILSRHQVVINCRQNITGNIFQYFE